MTYEIAIWGGLSTAYLRRQKIPRSGRTAKAALRALDRWYAVLDDYNVRAAHPVTIYRDGHEISALELQADAGQAA